MTTITQGLNLTQYLPFFISSDFDISNELALNDESLWHDDNKKSKLIPIQYDAPLCYVCGQSNPMGLKLRFTRESDIEIKTSLTIPDYWTGWGTMMHGGFHSILHDEIMAHIPFSLFNVRSFVTKSIEVQYRRPVYVNQKVTVHGYLEKREENLFYCRGEIRNTKGKVLSRSTSILMEINSDHMDTLAKTL